MKDTGQFEPNGGGEIYYTIAEVCALLKCSEPTLWRKCKLHGLRKIKIGGLVRFRKSILEKWIADHEDGDDSN